MDSKEILAVHSVLHLIYHRNKNQHHRAKWWKWLSILKRATLNLIRSEESQHLAQIIPRCYIAFSTVVADNQFSTLGVVLLSALARLSRLTGISHQMKMKSNSKKVTPVTAKVDIGERVRRVDVPVGVKVPEKAEKSEKDASKATKKKKKKKKKNAIDDLFSGLF
ncbi:uncharacterized protein N7515_003950 [Penicillium bovifimosum]|uniref:RNase MRP protein 1 RNA binding domain-containing protein n=1 Tax=Penicillium bovifimosum TaxID=126998 RepID=A0A9W9H5M4_9EURO|nr:uncharacterized protein N7515_003950 [Penicillium bovifimosum]KAJ5139102.1 hypothetical protein N7515_003950 [Penicillium bovifimosum]